MGVSGADDDVVQIQHPNKPGDPFIVTVNCPDKTGLACDICSIILDFGLCIFKGGFFQSQNTCLIPFDSSFYFNAFNGPILNVSFRCFNRWSLVLCCVVGYSTVPVASHEFVLSDPQRTTSGNLSSLFSLLLSRPAAFQIFSCLSVEVLLP
ncbi:hypothetical protein V8G54_027131 [Vigna mungo]|uniref:ACT domain-containing protein n=1 Tax=Vigna mungo TaxID=3915 RepID=A0AAQ3N1M6_VIGMU